MAKRTAPIRITAFLLLTACAVLCQESPAAYLLRKTWVEASEVREWRSLPDAPTPRQAERLPTFVDQGRSPLTLRSAGETVTPKGYIALGALPSSLTYSLPVHEEYDAKTFWDKHLHLSSPKQTQSPSSNGGFVKQTFAAASGVVITRDNSGNRRLNTSYLLGALSSAAIHTAYRPYGARSASATFNDLGSSVGSDAGVNVFHEFEPLVKGHIPQFVFRIQDRLIHGHTSSSR
jgi:hypothetical protein